MKFMKKNQVDNICYCFNVDCSRYLNFTADGDFRSADQTASSEEE